MTTSRGDDFPLLPNLKIGRAQQHLYELHAAVGIWVSGRPVTTYGTKSDDGRAWTAALRVHTPPPTQQWSLILGDIIHNLRSALDALIWHLATLNGNSPSKPKLIKFPVTFTESTWNDATKTALSGLSDIHIDRVRITQPFMRPEGDRPKDGLHLLSSLSNLDKHQSSIRVAASATEIQQTVRVDYGPDEVRERNMPPDIAYAFPELIDGAVFAVLKSTDPIVSVDGDFQIRLLLTLDTENGPQPLFETIAPMINYVQQIVQMILGGYIPDNPAQAGIGAVDKKPETDESEWLPLDITKRIDQDEMTQ